MNEATTFAMQQAVQWLRTNLRVPFLWDSSIDESLSTDATTSSSSSSSGGDDERSSTDIPLYLPGEVYWIEEVEEKIGAQVIHIITKCAFATTTPSAADTWALLLLLLVWLYS